MFRLFILQIVRILFIVSTIDCRLTVPENPRNITKQQTDDDFMNICSKSNVFENTSVNLSGKVSVVTKLPSSPFVLRQATMLNRLETRFHSAGFKNIQFVIINYGAGGSANQINNAIINNITIINGENDHRFAQFDLHSAYIYDHCERLAYIIYGPWSSIQRPYVKASILSTIYDAPCGECEIPYLEPSYPDISTIYSSSTESSFTTTQNSTTEEDDLKSSTINLDVGQTIDPVLATDADTTDDTMPFNRINDSPTTVSIFNETDNSDQAFVIPIRIIIHAKHAHRDPNNNETFLKYDSIVLTSNDTNYHEHLRGDQPEQLKIMELNHSLIMPKLTDKQPNETYPLNTTESKNGTEDIKPLKIMINDKGEHFESVTQHTILDENGKAVAEFEDLIPINLEQLYNSNLPIEEPSIARNLDDNDDVASSASDLDQKNDEHYGKILQWIHFNL